MRVKRMLGASLLLCSVALMAAGCQKGATERAEIPYHLVNATTRIDPQTGKIIRVAVWNYDNGETETTTEELPPGSATDDRRSKLPSPRFER